MRSESVENDHRPTALLRLMQERIAHGRGLVGVETNSEVGHSRMRPTSECKKSAYGRSVGRKVKSSWRKDVAKVARIDVEAVETPDGIL